MMVSKLTLFIRNPWRCHRHLSTRIRLCINIVACTFDVLLSGANLLLIVVGLILFMANANAVAYFTLIAVELSSAVTVMGTHDGCTAVPEIRARIVPFLASETWTTHFINRWKLKAVFLSCGNYRRTMWGDI